MKNSILFVLGILLFASCKSETASLPILGESYSNESGEKVYHSIPDFAFVNQNGDTITHNDVANKVYVVDFFFTSCPTICPVMKTQLLRFHEHFHDNKEIAILSHSIDPYHDSVSVLHDYAESLGIKGNQWQFLTGGYDDIYQIAEKSYLVAASKDTVQGSDSGGFIHSGAFVLIDKKRRIRGYYDGTKEEEVSKLIRDTELLLKEKDE